MASKPASNGKAFPKRSSTQAKQLADVLDDESSSGTSVTATDGSDHGSRSDEETPSPNEKITSNSEEQTKDIGAWAAKESHELASKNKLSQDSAFQDAKATGTSKKSKTNKPVGDKRKDK